ncbi:MAG: hypothetical protein OXQ92_01120 [Boseongicola sp.]|nr:hypothetical protein [Boseongicola sp.]MDD9977841.1 hypothetical protein [Boseongicola sp.]
MQNVIQMNQSVEDFNLDLQALQQLLATLSDKELAALEDDLDFANFTGIASDKIFDVVKSVGTAGEYCVAA